MYEVGTKAGLHRLRPAGAHLDVPVSDRKTLRLTDKQYQRPLDNCATESFRDLLIVTRETGGRSAGIATARSSVSRFAAFTMSVPEGRIERKNATCCLPHQKGSCDHQTPCIGVRPGKALLELTG